MIRALGSSVVVHGVHGRRWEAWPSALSTCDGVLGRRVAAPRAAVCGLANLGRACQCTGAMAVACSLSNLSLRLSRNYSHRSVGFTRRASGEIGAKQSNGRVRTLCIVMAGQRDGKETGVAGQGAGNRDSATSEGLREQLLVSSLVDEAPQVEHFSLYWIP